MTRTWGMLPESAEDAEKALQALRHAHHTQQEIGIVLSDMIMPGADGATLTEWIRQDPELKDTPVIVLTSGSCPGDAKRYRELNIAAHMMKPVKQSELLAAICQTLGAAQAPATGIAASQSATTAAAMSPLRILLAEDSVVNQKLAVALLEKRGHAVTVAATGEKALGALATGTFDVVLMDVEMPEMDGLTTTRAIRTREKQTGNHMPIVAMTAHAMKGDRERCLEAGMDAYVAKPVHAKELFATLAAVMKKQLDDLEDSSEIGGE